MSLRGKQANGLVTQQRVLRAAVAQFLEKGYTGTTTADITGAAGIAQSSFFHVFPSKEALLLELVRRIRPRRTAQRRGGPRVPLCGGNGAFTFYCHGAKEGKKLDVIRKNASVAFEMDCQNALQHGETACTHSYYYASVLGEGKAEILEGDEKCKGLSALMLHMAGRNDVFTAEMADKVAVIAIRVDALTAKKRPQPQP